MIASHSEELPPATKQILLGHSDLSRVHTALGRLGSLLSLPTDTYMSPLTLAEHGITNTQDGNITNGMRFYQNLLVNLENIYDLHAGHSPSDIQASLES